MISEPFGKLSTHSWAPSNTMMGLIGKYSMENVHKATESQVKK